MAKLGTIVARWEGEKGDSVVQYAVRDDGAILEKVGVRAYTGFRIELAPIRKAERGTVLVEDRVRTAERWAKQIGARLGVTMTRVI